MDERVYLNELFDCYRTLLTTKEQEVFLDYYSEDLSLGEIADNNKVSRNAIHKTLKIVEEKLKNYEKKLMIFKNKQVLKECLIQDDITKIKTLISQIVG